jgi:hypothetical protein
VAFLEADRELGPDIASVIEAVRTEALLGASERVVGRLN